MLFVVTTLNYADRATLSITGTPIRKAFGIAPREGSAAAMRGRRLHQLAERTAPSMSCTPDVISARNASRPT